MAQRANAPKGNQKETERKPKPRRKEASSLNMKKKFLLIFRKRSHQPGTVGRRLTTLPLPLSVGRPPPPCLALPSPSGPVDLALGRETPRRPGGDSHPPPRRRRAAPLSAWVLPGHIITLYVNHMIHRLVRITIVLFISCYIAQPNIRTPIYCSYRHYCFMHHHPHTN